MHVVRKPLAICRTIEAAHKTATANFFGKIANTFVVFKKRRLGQCNIVRAKLLIDLANDIIFNNTQ